MDREFWDARWDQNKIAFHEDRPNTLLSEQFDNLSLRAESTVFVPLCGMAIDLDWLNSRGHHVVGIEFNRRAVEDVFKRRKINPDVQQRASHAHYKADGIDLFVGDFFDLTSELVGPVDVVYDRVDAGRATSAARS